MMAGLLLFWLFKMVESYISIFTDLSVINTVVLYYD